MSDLVKRLRWLATSTTIEAADRIEHLERLEKILNGIMANVPEILRLGSNGSWILGGDNDEWQFAAEILFLT